MLAWVGAEGLGRFRRRREARLGEGSGLLVWQGCEGSGRFPCGLLPCNLDRSSRVLVLITGIPLSTWAKRRPCSQSWHKA